MGKTGHSPSACASCRIHRPVRCVGVDLEADMMLEVSHNRPTVRQAEHYLAAPWAESCRCSRRCAGDTQTLGGGVVWCSAGWVLLFRLSDAPDRDGGQGGCRMRAELGGQRHRVHAGVATPLQSWVESASRRRPNGQRLQLTQRHGGWSLRELADAQEAGLAAAAR